MSMTASKLIKFSPEKLKEYCSEAPRAPVIYRNGLHYVALDVYAKVFEVWREDRKHLLQYELKQGQATANPESSTEHRRSLPKNLKPSRSIALPQRAQERPPRMAASRSPQDTPEQRTLLDVLQGQLMRGLVQFHDGLSRSANAACVGFLIEHCLWMAYKAQREQNGVCKTYMYYSLHSIASRLERYQGRQLSGFQNVVRQLAPVMERFPSTIELSSHSHDQHSLFQLILRDLRDYAQLEFVPFFYGLDTDQKPLGFI